MFDYTPGTHVIATLVSRNTVNITSYEAFSAFITTLIQRYELQLLGTVYHDFEPGGFTAVLCLSESHISIHTWPEFNKINLDIYLSNFLRTNDGTVVSIFDSLVSFFAAEIESFHKIIR